MIEQPEDEESDEESSGDETSSITPTLSVNNPRIHPSEKWHAHTTRKLVLRLIDLLMTHYPERLKKALVVVGHGRWAYVRTKLRGKLALSVTVPSNRTRERVRFLTRYKELQEFVDPEVLVKFVGGNADVSPSAFEYC